MNRDSRRLRFVLALLLLTAVTLVTLDYRSGRTGVLADVRSAAQTVVSPLERGVSDVTGPIGREISALWHAHSYAVTEARLEKEIAALRYQLRTAGAVQTEQAHLNALLHLARAGDYTIVPAAVIAVGSLGGLSWTATISVGSHEGVTPGQTVIDGEGLVGRVEAVSPDAATVLLAIDPASVVGARLERTSQLGLVTGDGLGPMHLQLLSTTATIRVGDLLVTRASPDGFIGGVPIGRVTRVVPTPGQLYRTADVVPFVSFTSLDTVGVVLAAPVDPGYRLLTQVPGGGTGS